MDVDSHRIDQVMVTRSAAARPYGLNQALPTTK